MRGPQYNIKCHTIPILNKSQVLDADNEPTIIRVQDGDRECEVSVKLMSQRRDNRATDDLLMNVNVKGSIIGYQFGVDAMKLVAAGDFQGLEPYQKRVVERICSRALVAVRHSTTYVLMY